MARKIDEKQYGIKLRNLTIKALENSVRHEIVYADLHMMAHLIADRFIRSIEKQEQKAVGEKKQQ